MNGAPKVFISYSHDDDAHKARVLELADRLCDPGGVEAVIDRYAEPYPPEGWPAWCWRQIDEADFILMVCADSYHRRVTNKEEKGKGHGVCWEAPMIFQLMYDQGSVGKRFAPVLLAGGSADQIPLPVRKFGRFEVDTDAGWKQLLCHLHDEQPVPRPRVSPRPALTPERRPGMRDHTPAPTPVPPAPPTQADRVFVGREEELATLAALLLSAARQRFPVVVSGMAGVGKSYLVDRFYLEHKDDLPGGYHRVALDPTVPGSVEDLFAQIAARMNPPTTDPGLLRARLLEPLALVHVENVDSREAAAIAGASADLLPDCALVFSARFGALAAGTGWGEVKLQTLSPDLALDQLQQELRGMAGKPPSRESLEPVARELGGLPLALHLAAGYLRTGETPSGFLHRLARKGLELPPINPADPCFRERKRLSATFALSVDALEREGGAGASWRAGFEALGCGAVAGFGQSLGAAIADLDADAFDDMTLAAARLSLLERRPRGEGFAVRLHPLLAEFGRARADRGTTVARITGWFCERLPKPAAGEAWRWNEVHAETAALLEWLPLVPAADRLRVVRAGMGMAINTGPFQAWQGFCESVLVDATDETERADVLWTLGHVSRRGGDLEAAWRYANELVQIVPRMAARDAALALGLFAEIIRARGQPDEALRIRQSVQLPIFERLGDARGRAVTLGKIADILQDQGQPDEALRIRREEELPTYELLDDAREHAICWGKIATILHARGKSDEALRIRREKELPVYERLGDVRSRAMTMAQVADIQEVRGELGEALRIYREEVLPVFEHLCDERSASIAQFRIAQLLEQNGDKAQALHLMRAVVVPRLERLAVPDLLNARLMLVRLVSKADLSNLTQEACELLCLALTDARRLKHPWAEQIEAILMAHGLSCD